MNVLVVGATGVLGRHVVPRLIERRHQVRALVRRPEQFPSMIAAGAEPVLGDILDLDGLLRAASGIDAILHLATAIPKPGGAQGWDQNDRVRTTGTERLLEAARRGGVMRYVQQSITFLYGDLGTGLADEASPLSPTPLVQSAADMEALVQASPLSWSILRGGAFYGPGTGKEEQWRLSALDGSLRLPDDSDALLSLIHVVDMAKAVVLAMESAPVGAIYNVVDDEPVSYRDLYGYVAAQVGAAPPSSGGPAVRSLGCDNSRLRDGLGWRPAYATYRSGLTV
jgi:nucleoside-diphosphate-sugar epimerase